MAALECTGIGKRYGSVVAVDGASFAARAGEIHAVVGENGAGKSTLLKIAAGLEAPDEGRVLVLGTPLSPHTPAEALRRGVAMVQQHFALVEAFTALENIALGAEPTSSFGRIDRAATRARASAVLSELGVTLPLDAPVSTLGIGDRQRVEIARALHREAAVLVLDEPTSVLAPQEAEVLYAALRRLAERGRAIVVVTHKLDEVRGHADAVTAMRRGKVVLRAARPPGGELDVDALAAAIMGDDAPPPPERRPRALGDVVLDAHDLTAGRGLAGVTLEVRAGEIVGVAGVDGNGQRELVGVLAGRIPLDAGTLRVEGRGAAFVHEDRHGEGLVLGASLRDNLLLGELGRFTRLGVLDRSRVDEAAAERASRGGVRPADLELPARALSGGNQQKVVVVRAMSRGASLLVLAHPTRGVDLGAARAIHAQVLDAARDGAAVLVVSAELAELRALADRVVVMRRGRLVATFEPTASDAAIGAAMLGGDAA